MDIAKIEELIRTLESSSARELSVRKGGFSVQIKKGVVPPKRQADSAPQTPAKEHKAPKEQLIRAPMVGIFHPADNVAQPGARIESGTVVGAIESMKLLNDVVSQFSGVVREVLVEDGSPVEYGQPLYRIEVCEQ
ncbi:MAG: biotin/lipoyl-binding protein [Armatimonadota bacterium]|nr:biotin/lipoyl-binding protein [Armatimonadota bacterium]